MLREVAPAEASKSEPTSIAITGTGLKDARLFLRADGKETELKPDAITGDFEIMLTDRRFEELPAGTYDIVVRTGQGESELARAFLLK